MAATNSFYEMGLAGFLHRQNIVFSSNKRNVTSYLTTLFASVSQNNKSGDVKTYNGMK
jgi:hypothetical protein